MWSKTIEPLTEYYIDEASRAGEAQFPAGYVVQEGMEKNIHTLDSVAKSFSLTREDAMCLLPGVVIPQVAPCTVIGAKLQKVIFESLPESNPHFPLPGISIADAMAHGVSWTQAHTKNADEVVLTSVEPCTPVVLWVKWPGYRQPRSFVTTVKWPLRTRHEVFCWVANEIANRVCKEFAGVVPEDPRWLLHQDSWKKMYVLELHEMRPKKGIRHPSFMAVISMAL